MYNNNIPPLWKWFYSSTASAASLERPKNQKLVADQVSQLTKQLKGIYNNMVEMLWY